MNINKILTVIQKNLSNFKQAYIVGGYVRDTLLSRKITDIDIVVDSDPETVSGNIAEEILGTFVKLHEKRKIYRVVKDGYNFDFSLLKGKDIYKDLSNRDFTINSIAVELKKLKKFSLIDPYNGQKDIKRKLIRKISDNIFIYDPLRLLRAWRFSAELNFQIEPQTRKLIWKYANLISKSAKERILQELVKIFSSDNACSVIDEMDRCGILSIIIPEIETMKKSPTKYYFHKKGLWQHSLESLCQLEQNILSKLQKLFLGYGNKIKMHISPRLSLLKFITLFHDISKPETVEIIKGRPRFFEHETKGAISIKKIFKRLRMSNENIKIAEKLVKNHMRPGNLSQLKNVTKKAIYHFWRDIGEESIDLLLLSFADRYSYLKITGRKKDISVHKNFVKMMIKEFFRQKEEVSKKPKLLDGHVIMKEFKLSPGPLIGKLLRLVDENQALGKISSRTHALLIIKKYLLKTYPR